MVASLAGKFTGISSTTGPSMALNISEAQFAFQETRKLKYFGHVIRANGKQRELLEGHIEGKRGRGRKRRDWVKDIELCTQDNHVNCVET